MAQDETKDKLIHTIFAYGTKQQLPKGHLIVHQGDRMNQMYYIQKGIVRGYYLDEEGKEITKCFSAEEEIFGVEGFLYGRPASYYIECIEAVDCIRLTYDRVQEWMAEDIHNAALANQLIIHALEIMEERARALLVADAAKRYENFLREYGPIASRLKQKCIASYLGINEASLCRLKRKIDLGQ